MAEPLNTPTPQQARDAAIVKVERGMDPEWEKAALEQVRKIALAERTFTTDDLWLAMQDSELSTPEPRAAGSIMRTARNRGWIQPTMMFQPSKRRSRHCAPIRIWRSLLCPL